MNFLFSEEGRRRLDEMIKPGILCLFDFDGTLAPIAPRPDQAEISGALLRRLDALSPYAKIGVISGRSQDDLRTRLQFNADFTIGNHGIEGLPGWENSAGAYEALCQRWARTLNSEFDDPQTFDAGIRLENKRYSLSVHYRLARDHAATERQLKNLIMTLEPRPRVLGGKCVFNLLPAGAADKGCASGQLLLAAGAPGAIYVGDDITDEDVFQLRRRDILSVRVEPDPNSAAELYLRDRGELPRLLDELIQRLSTAKR